MRAEKERCGIPAESAGIRTARGKRERVEKWVNLLIDFRLAVDRHKQSASKLNPERRRARR